MPHGRHSAFLGCQAKGESALRRLADAGATADGEVGDADPMKAVKAALRRQFDEIIVSTLPERLSSLAAPGFPRRLEHERFHLPVTHPEAAAAPSD